MGNPLTLLQFARLADKRLDDVIEDYLSPTKSMIPKVFGTKPLDKAFWEGYSIGSVPDIPAFNGKLDFLGIAPGYYTRIEPGEFAAGIQLERKLRDDKQYEVLDDLQAGLGTALNRTREKQAVGAFTGAFSTAWSYMTNEEAVALCGSHSTKSGASTTTGFSNTGTSAASKTTIAATRILMKKFRNDIGDFFDEGEPDAIVCPESLVDTISEALGTSGYASSQLDPDSANHKINTQYGRYEIIPWVRLDDNSTKNWFMVNKSMMKKFLIWIDRIKGEPSTQVDFHTFAILQSIYARFGWGWRDWRWLYGQNVS
jgi:hypothetical protein